MRGDNAVVEAGRMTSKARILVVEDENLIAQDIHARLRTLGYAVAAMASSGEDAIRKALEARPDLILMDIVLKGDMDGIEAAKRIHERLDVPIVYLTAYADDHTLQRAKVTEPFGYILKPFEERELHTTIETALYKHQMERKLKESQHWFSATLRSLGDAIVASDRDGRVSFMNMRAEQLTGWRLEEVLGRELSEVVTILTRESGRAEDPHPGVKALQRDPSAALEWKEHCLVGKNGRQIRIEDSAAPVTDERGQIIGVVLMFRDAAQEPIAMPDRLGLSEDLRVLELQREVNDLLRALGRPTKYGVKPLSRA